MLAQSEVLKIRWYSKYVNKYVIQVSVVKSTQNTTVLKIRRNSSTSTDSTDDHCLP